jgi:PadR family transcriptional regulator PadR
MRRKAGTLVPLEVGILEASIALRARGLMEAHGFLLARTIGDETGAKRLTAYGTLYKALDRLERAGHVESRWEEPDFAAEAARPRRRFYRITASGRTALAEATKATGRADPSTARSRPDEVPVR